MTSKRKRIIGQDKDITGKLSKTSVKNAVGKFKEQYADRCDNFIQPIVGFELNGGTGMTKGGQEEWVRFQKWCVENNLYAEYNTKEDLNKMKKELRNRVENKLKNKV